MSNEKRHEEALRWLSTALDDLEIAQLLFENSRYAGACFHAQQAGEKALKALSYNYCIDPWGHSLVKLVDNLQKVTSISEQISFLKKEAMALDRFYIPTRYPDGLPDITPMEAFSDIDAKTANSYAGHFIELAKQVIGN